MNEEPSMPQIDVGDAHRPLEAASPAAAATDRSIGDLSVYDRRGGPPQLKAILISSSKNAPRYDCARAASQLKTPASHAHNDSPASIRSPASR